LAAAVLVEQVTAAAITPVVGALVVCWIRLLSTYLQER
jgi:hypothetical protein